jgi:hypothetical protein
MSSATGDDLAGCKLRIFSGNRRPDANEDLKGGVFQTLIVVIFLFHRLNQMLFI